MPTFGLNTVDQGQVPVMSLVTADPDRVRHHAHADHGAPDWLPRTEL